MTSPDPTIGDVLNWALPPISIAIWCAIYVIYFWRQQHVRDWFSRVLYHHRSRPRRRFVRRHPAPPPAIFRPPPPAPPVQRPRPAMITAAAGPVASAARLAEWRVDNLPLRYRLLGEVRRADNDN